MDTLGSAPRKSIEWNEQGDKAGAEPENVNQESIKNESFPGDNPNANNELSRNGEFVYMSPSFLCVLVRA